MALKTSENKINGCHHPPVVVNKKDKKTNFNSFSKNINIYVINTILVSLYPGNEPTSQKFRLDILFFCYFFLKYIT